MLDSPLCQLLFPASSDTGTPPGPPPWHGTDPLLLAAHQPGITGATPTGICPHTKNERPTMVPIRYLLVLILLKKKERRWTLSPTIAYTSRKMTSFLFVVCESPSNALDSLPVIIRFICRINPL